MKRIDLAKGSPTLPQLLLLADADEVLLQTREGRHYLLAEIDDFDEEIGAVVKNKALMKLLAERSRERATVPLSEVRARLNGKEKPAGKTQRKKR